jgi:hypothetical protein
MFGQMVRKVLSEFIAADFQVVLTTGFFDVFSDQVGALLEKSYAFTSAEVVVDSSAMHLYCVLFNANPKYQIIERIHQEPPIP